MAANQRRAYWGTAKLDDGDTALEEIPAYPGAVPATAAEDVEAVEVLRVARLVVPGYQPGEGDD